MFNLGDKVDFLPTCAYGQGANAGVYYGIVVRNDVANIGQGNVSLAVYAKDTDKVHSIGCIVQSSYLTKIGSSKTVMGNIKDFFTLARLPEPEKSFRKAGITNGDNLLTADGQIVFLSYLLEKNKDAFKKEVVDAILADQEKK